MPTAQASGCLCLYPAAGTTAGDALTRRLGILTMESHLRRKRKKKILELLKPSYIQGFTLLGGEPFEPENQPVLAGLLKRIRQTYPNKDIWCYSGYLYDVDMQQGGRAYTEYTQKMLQQLNVLVDGEFVEARKDLTLVFRGSSNQRLLCIENGAVCGTWSWEK